MAQSSYGYDVSVVHSVIQKYLQTINSTIVESPKNVWWKIFYVDFEGDGGANNRHQTLLATCSGTLVRVIFKIPVMYSAICLGKKQLTHVVELL